MDELVSPGIPGRFSVPGFHEIDLPKNLGALDREGGAVVLTVRVVVPGEVVEADDGPQDLDEHIGADCGDAPGDEAVAADPSAAQLVVKVADPRRLVRVGHVAPPVSAGPHQ